MMDESNLSSKHTYQNLELTIYTKIDLFYFLVTLLNDEFLWLLVKAEGQIYPKVVIFEILSVIKLLWSVLAKFICVN